MMSSFLRSSYLVGFVFFSKKRICFLILILKKEILVHFFKKKKRNKTTKVTKLQQHPALYNYCKLNRQALFYKQTQKECIIQVIEQIKAHCCPSVHTPPLTFFSFFFSPLVTSFSLS